MPTNVSLLRYTEQGIRNVKEGPARLDAAKKAFKAAGGELKQFFLLMGHYDMLVVWDAPDDETAGKIILALGSLGNVRTESFRAFPEAEFRKLIAGLP
ncbi:GYD domain-containing protein [Anaeromyxobacter terrae]|uniref:GYD domain-containing protein n=1 Tax=Anaeromyxobacter terrae TaxID=2925406 RepID=UPI001F5AC95B|nr:GYD domain-containing protein [Anaeromyxobacter sp. SG22]